MNSHVRNKGVFNKTSCSVLSHARIYPIRTLSQQGRVSIVGGNERDNRGREERGRGGVIIKRGGGGRGEDNDDYNGEFNCHNPPYSSSSQIEADAAEDMTMHLD